MKQCPICKREMKQQLLFCPFDGHALVTIIEKDKFVGSILDEKYRLDEKIGEGGMGTVYKATHVHMDSTVAVKILHSHLASDEMALERFRREARAAAQIRHPNAVAVTDFGVSKDTGVAYLVMELLEGLELRDKIKQQKQLGYEETFLIVQQTCAALYVAHSKGIIHRDLKPDNIWLLKSEDGIDRVKVFDFGIAKLNNSTEMSKLTQQGMIVGTPYYMSPEQCRGEELDPRSDVYSIGVIIYEMLTGQVPFQASSPIGVVLKHTSEPPRPLSELRKDIPWSLEQIVLRALHKKPEDRQDSATQLAQEFEKALYEAGIELKLLGTKTPKSFFSTTNATPAPPAYRTPPQIEEPTDKIVAPETAETAQMGQAQSDIESATGLGSQTPAIKLADRPGSDYFITETRSRIDLSAIGIKSDTQRRIFFGSLATLALIMVVSVIIWSQRKPLAVENGKTGPGSAAATVSPKLETPPGMIYVPGGTFTMGYDGSDEPTEKPEHPVAVRPFFLDQYEVTNEEFYKFVKATGRRAPEGWKGEKFPQGQDKFPVTNITWYDARAYAEWAKKRLPTEAEWEYAARGTDKRLYPWGNDFNPRFANTGGSQQTTIMPVGKFPAGKSPSGAYDMAGNVFEWTDSDSFPYPGNNVAPRAGKIMRGGSFLQTKVYAMTTSRSVKPADYRKEDLGFRCARDAPE